MPVKRGDMICYKQKWYRASDASFNCQDQQWMLHLHDEKVQGPALIKVSTCECAPMFNSDWRKFKGEWLPVLDDTPIPQLDGSTTNNMNAGERVRELVKHFEINEESIKEEVDYVRENGIDTVGLAGAHSRFNEYGFAMKAPE